MKDRNKERTKKTLKSPKETARKKEPKVTTNPNNKKIALANSRRTSISSIREVKEFVEREWRRMTAADFRKTIKRRGRRN